MEFRDKVLNYAKISPVICVGASVESFDDAIILESNIASKNLGIVNTINGIKAPKWFLEVKKTKNPILIINGIDKIDKYNQEKFYELLKYKTISNIDLPKDTKIIVLVNSLDKVSENILSLCTIIK